MFHSSGLRHEQYLIRTKLKSSKAVLQTKKRSSIESNNSGTDSGYASTTSSVPSIVRTNGEKNVNPSITNHVIETVDDNNEISVNRSTKETKNAASISLHTSSSSTTNTTASTINTKKKRTKPRQPDLVYACPRPLTFPFHNDDQFLPIAEADPRDVARLSPSTKNLMHRASSLQSNETHKTSLLASTVGSTRMFDSYSYNNSTKHKVRNSKQTVLDPSAASSTYSQRSSLLGSIQQGTVRSLRSLFQLPNYSFSISSNKNSTTISVQKLEIKKGTVQSLKDMFSKKRERFAQQQQITSTSKKGFQLTASNTMNTMNQFESMYQPTMQIENSDITAIQRTTTKTNKSFRKSINNCISTIFNQKKPEPPLETSHVHNGPDATPKIASDNENRFKNGIKTLKERVVIMSQKVSSTLKTPSGNDTHTENVLLSSKPQENKRSIFSIFKRQQKTPDISPISRNKQAPNNVGQVQQPGIKSSLECSLSTSSTTTIGKVLEGFKKLISRRSNSRVGAL